MRVTELDHSSPKVCFPVITKNIVLSMITLFIVIASVLVSYAAPENLDEAVSRKSRMATAAYSNILLENSANNYSWQPETLSYTDIASNNEVWLLTNSPANFNQTQDISVTHWSANGNRVLFQSKRPTAAFNTFGGSVAIWMVTNPDGSLMRPAKNAAAHFATTDKYPLWSPILADVLYQGSSNDGQPLDANGFYKVQISDTVINRNLLLNVPGSSRISLKKAISGDGRKVMITDVTNGKYQPATVYPETSKGFDTANGYSNQLVFDFYWGKDPAGWFGYHDQFMSGAINGIDGVWNYIMPEGADGSLWRARLTGSGASQAPVTIQDHVPPYAWGGELEPINSPANGLNPWCPQGVVAGTDCMEYFSHFAPDRWGHYSINTKSNQPPYGTSIADLRKHAYKVAGFTPIQLGGVNAQWVQHHDWDAWSDWSTSTAYPNSGDYLNGAVVTQNINSVSSQKMLASTHTRLNSGIGPYESLARPTQSPDGTKVLFNTTLLNASDDYPQLSWTVAYYPYPPEIKSAAKSGSSIRLTWDFNQGTAAAPNLTNPRTYATRGWPHETNDRPPSPREIKQFRVWSSSDNLTWTPLGTSIYNNCSGTNECGMWTETAWTYDAAQANGTTKYYAVTSMEQSGLESQTLSNTWKVVVDGSGAIVSQAQQAGYPTAPGGKSGFYTTKPAALRTVQFDHHVSPASASGQYVVKWNAPEYKSLIRYYNIYAHDGGLPFTSSDQLLDRQKSRIASIPASSDYDGSGSFQYIDWLGAVDGSTKYIVTAVDFQGNETSDVTVSGDLNGDGRVDTADALMAQQMSVGLLPQNADEIKRGDVAPLGAPDGKINTGDAVVILHKIVGNIK